MANRANKSGSFVANAYYNISKDSVISSVELQRKIYGHENDDFQPMFNVLAGVEKKLASMGMALGFIAVPRPQKIRASKKVVRLETKTA
jgi:hypothetical protein